MDLICIFLLANVAERVFMGFLATCMSSLVRSLLMFFACFLIGLLVFLLLSFESSLYIPIAIPLSDR